MTTKAFVQRTYHLNATVTIAYSTCVESRGTITREVSRELEPRDVGDVVAKLLSNKIFFEEQRVRTKLPSTQFHRDALERHIQLNFPKQHKANSVIDNKIRNT